MAADEGEEVPDEEEANETPSAGADPRGDVKADERPSAAFTADPGAAAVAKAVRRLSFSSGGGNEPKKLKTSSGRAKELRKTAKRSRSARRRRLAWFFRYLGSTID